MNLQHLWGDKQVFAIVKQSIARQVLSRKKMFYCSYMGCFIFVYELFYSTTIYVLLYTMYVFLYIQ